MICIWKILDLVGSETFLSTGLSVGLSLFPKRAGSLTSLLLSKHLLIYVVIKYCQQHCWTFKKPLYLAFLLCISEEIKRKCKYDLGIFKHISNLPQVSWRPNWIKSKLSHLSRWDATRRLRRLAGWKGKRRHHFRLTFTWKKRLNNTRLQLACCKLFLKGLIINFFGNKL